jgi:hypothetical protein
MRRRTATQSETDVSTLAKIAVILAVLYAAVLAAAYFGQRRLMYFPDRQRVAPAAIGLAGVTEIVLNAPDGAYNIAWWGKARPGQPTILYFHGNGGGLIDRKPRIERFMAEGWGVLMMAYRGYAGSTGSPTEGDNIADALRAHAHLVASGVPPGRIVAYGESLGTGVATALAEAQPVAGLILDAPYTSTVDVALSRYPYLPVRRYLRDRYETSSRIARVSVPILILHGARDEVIPVALGREVARLAGARATFIELPNGMHSDLYINGNNALDHVRAWMAKLK